jgi:hypothetical protein
MKSIPTTEQSTAPTHAVVSLKTPMSIQPSTKLYLICGSRIKVRMPLDQHLFINATTPTAISGPSIVHISPAANLGVEFAHGWRSLPDELNLSVLSHIVLLSDTGVKKSAKSRTVYDSPPHDELRRCLHMGPDIASLVHELFYTRKVFSVKQ